MTDPTRALIAITAAVLLLPSHGMAQERQPTISVGDHVRLYSPAADSLRAEGRVERLEPGRIFLSPGDGSGSLARALEWNDVIGVRRSMPAGRGAGRGALWGTFIGASLGGIVAPFAMRSTDSADPAARSVLMGAGLGSAVGAGVGALVGYLMPGHRWEYVRVEYELTGIERTGS